MAFRHVNRTEHACKNCVFRCASTSTKETCQELGYCLAQHQRPYSRQSVSDLIKQAGSGYKLHAAQIVSLSQAALGAWFCRHESDIHSINSY